MDHSSKLERILTILLVLAAAASIGLLAWICQYKANPAFLAHTVCAGVDISGQTPEQVADMLGERAEQMTIVLKEDGQEALSGSAADFGYYYDREATAEAMEAVMNAQKDDTTDVLRSMTGLESEVPAAAQWGFNLEDFRAKVAKSNLSEERIASEGPKLAYDEENKVCIVQDPIYGNEFNEEEFRSWMNREIVESLMDGDVSEPVSLEFPKELYDQPEMVADEEYLAKRCEAKNAYAGAEVTYQMGEQDVVIGYDTIMSWLDIKDGEATLNEKRVLAFVKRMKMQYDTLYVDRKFTTSLGRVVTISGKKCEYGTRIDEEQEYEQLLADVKSRKAVKREPIYDKATNTYGTRNGADDLNGNYVEVSIPDQHVWLYKDGKLVLDTDCVTGDVKKKGRATTPGVYSVTFKKSPAVLKGGTGDQHYESPVTYWMPFNGGQGLHDATWRGRFGGTIYRGHGSHGCVNLPKKMAKEIYATIEKGYPVVVYGE